MEPNTPTQSSQPTSYPAPANPPASAGKTQPDTEKQKHDDAYAAALARMTALDYEMQEKHQPEVKHFISKKMIIYTVISLIISILGLIIGDVVMKKNAPANDTNGNNTVNQLLDTTKEVRSYENQP